MGRASEDVLSRCLLSLLPHQTALSAAYTRSWQRVWISTWLQVEAAQKRAPFSERKEKRRKRSEADATPAADAAALGPSPAATALSPAAAKETPDTAAPRSPATDALPKSEAPQRKKPKKEAAAPEDLPPGSAAGGKPERKPKTMPLAASAKQLLVRTVALGNLPPDASARALAYAQSVTEVDSMPSTLLQLAMYRGHALLHAGYVAWFHVSGRFTRCRGAHA